MWSSIQCLFPPLYCKFQYDRTMSGVFFFFSLLYLQFWHKKNFFLRKISPELTSATNPPLFAEEDWPWANIRAHPPPLYMWEARPSMAWQAVHMSASQDPGWQTLDRRNGTCELNRCATKPALPTPKFFWMKAFTLYNVNQRQHNGVYFQMFTFWVSFSPLCTLLPQPTIFKVA